MKKTLVALSLLLVCSFVQADISLPKKDNIYDKLGRGLANLIGAPAEVLDSVYYYNEVEGGTAAVTKGLFQGTGRMLMDAANGVFDMATAPIPMGPGRSYRSIKARPWNSMVVNEYPPSDLKNWW